MKEVVFCHQCMYFLVFCFKVEQRRKRWTPRVKEDVTSIHFEHGIPIRAPGCLLSTTVWRHICCCEANKGRGKPVVARN